MIRTILFASLLCLLPFTPLAAQDSYAAQWAKIEKLAEKAKPGKAFETARAVYEDALRTNQPLPLLRSILYMSALYSNNADKNRLFGIAEMEKTLPKLEPPYRNVLESMLAEAYQQYWSANRWNFYNRTDTAHYRAYDINTWLPMHFQQAIREHYLASLENKTLLQQTASTAFGSLIAAGNIAGLRPTLYDILAQHALSFFFQPEGDVRPAAGPFGIPDSVAYAPADQFVQALDQLADSTLSDYPALRIYKDLYHFRKTNPDPAALIDADLLRIEYVRQRFIGPGNDSFYTRALRYITRQFPDHPAADQATYQLAQLHADYGDRWKMNGSQDFRYEKIAARELANKTLVHAAASEGKTNAIALLERLHKPSIDLDIEEVNLPGQPFRVLLTYRNTPNTWLRIIPFSESYRTDYYNLEFSDVILSAAATREWQQALPGTEDLQEHAAEIKVDALPTGHYILLVSSGADFTDRANAVTAQSFYVSRLALINSDSTYFIIDRRTGQPLAGAVVQAWEKYNSAKYALDYLRGNQYITDSIGRFVFNYKSTRSAVENVLKEFDVRYKNDQLYVHTIARPSAYRFRSYYTPGTAREKFSVIYTDRSIYRPGQFILFKAILFMRDSTGKSGSVLPNEPVKIYFKNPSYTITDSLILTTNRFGAVSGQFRAPVSGATGTYYIDIPDGKMISVAVEEYKRPRFSATFEPVTQLFKLGDSISVKGLIKALAGYAVSDAQISYSVVRSPLIPPIYRYDITEANKTQTVTVAAGSIASGPDGSFQISFLAIADSNLAKQPNTGFSFLVSATINDETGETHVIEKNIEVTTSSIQQQNNIPLRSELNNLDQLRFSVTNQQDQFVPATITVSFARIRDENRLIRPRKWSRPDQFAMSRNEYLQWFPRDEYDNESLPQNRSLAGDSIIYRFPAQASGNWPSEKAQQQLQPGFYWLTVIAVSGSDEPVLTRQVIEIGEGAPRYISQQFPGEAILHQPVNGYLQTAADTMYLIQRISIGSNLLRPAADTFALVRLYKGKKELGFYPNEQHRGGFSVNWIGIKDNALFETGNQFRVPWNDKRLAIEYSSFRSKLSPGDQEQWKIRIRQSDSTASNAEVLAGLYDASLDLLQSHQWQLPVIWPEQSAEKNWGAIGFSRQSGHQLRVPPALKQDFTKRYDRLLSSYVFTMRERDAATQPLWWLNPLNYVYDETRNPRLMRLPKPVFPDSDGDGVPDQRDMQLTPPGCPVDASGVAKDSDNDGIPDCQDTNSEEEQTPRITPRKNFNETAFFYPHIVTNDSGYADISFTLPESLTQWKFQAIAHTPSLEFGYTNRTAVTQKPFMVQPNMPRFLRENDTMQLRAKLTNLGSDTLRGTALLELLDEAAARPVDSLFGNRKKQQAITVYPGQSLTVSFPVRIPAAFNGPVTWRITAGTRSSNGNHFADGEENTVNVLPNRILVTETMPLTGPGNYRFEKLLAAGSSRSLQHYSLQVSYSSNPVWSALRSLPYLMEYPWECAEQTWNRYYANTLSSSILQASPRMQEIAQQWQAAGDSLQDDDTNTSGTIAAEETPWATELAAAKNQGQTLARLFNTKKIRTEQQRLLRKLSGLQHSSGGFGWFAGDAPNRYITQYIVCGIGHLLKLTDRLQNSKEMPDASKLRRLAEDALAYSDELVSKRYREWLDEKKQGSDFYPLPSDIQYLYMRSFFREKELKNKNAFRFLSERARQSAGRYSLQLQAMIALSLYRTGENAAAEDLLKNINDKLKKDSTGMYWEQNRPGWYWYESQIETQALLVEAFAEIKTDTAAVEQMKKWLLLQQQTNHWPTTIATAEACYALLLQGNNWLEEAPAAEIKMGAVTINSASQQTEAGTGYFKRAFTADSIQPAMGAITVALHKPGGGIINSPSWGAVYWQYFEEMEKLTTAATPLVLTRKLFLERNNGKSIERIPLVNGSKIKVGERIIVQVTLKADRDMEFVHMKDQRAAALEPDNVLSQYKWQGTLGYYESTRDASSSFFFSYLPKGTHVFEYSLHATHAGNFSNAITTVQCMYAPAFSAHSEAVRIRVE